MSHTEATNAEPLRTFGWSSGDSPSTALVTAVADLDDESPLSLPPLYHAIDPDALESIFSPSQARGDPLAENVQFEYHGYHVRLTADGQGVIRDADCGLAFDP